MNNEQRWTLIANKRKYFNVALAPVQIHERLDSTSRSRPIEIDELRVLEQLEPDVAAAKTALLFLHSFSNFNLLIYGSRQLLCLVYRVKHGL